MQKPLDTTAIEGNELAFLRLHRSATSDLGFGNLFLSSMPDVLSWNFLGRLRTVDHESERLLATAESIFRDWQRTPCIKVTPATRPKGLITILDATGWKAELSLTHMIHVRTGRRAKGKVSVRICRTPEDIAAFSEVQSRGFGVPEWQSWVHRINLINRGRRGQRFYIAERRSRPVGVTLLLSAGSIGGIYAVATLPEERGRGVATALVRRAIEDSRRDGNRMTVLNTASGGDARVVFARLGFSDAFESVFFEKS